jgi:hypothetical protein
LEDPELVGLEDPELIGLEDLELVVGLEELVVVMHSSKEIL